MKTPKKMFGALCFLAASALVNASTDETPVANQDSSPAGQSLALRESGAKNNFSPSMSIEEKIHELGLTLPPPPAPAGAYVPAVRTGNLLFLSGTLPMGDGKITHTGMIGSSPEKDIAYGYAAARQCALAALANAKAFLGSLDRVKRVINVNGFVFAPEGFADAPKVINGASELFLAIFGENGKHARAAVALGGVPLNATVEVQVILEVE